MKKFLMVGLFLLWGAFSVRSEVISSISTNPASPTIVIPNRDRVGGATFFVSIFNTGSSTIFWRQNVTNISLTYDIPIPPNSSYSGVLYGSDGRYLVIRSIALVVPTGETGSCVIGFQ